MRWNDNSTVTVASNCLEVEPTNVVSQWSKHHGRRIHVRQPNGICEYNKNMAGSIELTRMLNAAESTYVLRSGGGVFVYLLDISLQNV